MSKVMTSFVRSKARISRKHEGSGLGLPLAKHLVELHGGTMTLESQVNAGTTVTVVLRLTESFRSAVSDADSCASMRQTMEHAITGLATIDPRLRQIADHLMTLGKILRHSAPYRSGAKLLPHLFVLDIERDTAKRTASLRIRLVGTALDDVFHRPLRGHTLEEFIHGPRGKEVIASFHHCADTRQPIWMRQIVHIRDRAPRFVEAWRST